MSGYKYRATLYKLTAQEIPEFVNILKDNFNTIEEAFAFVADYNDKTLNLPRKTDNPNQWETKPGDNICDWEQYYSTH